MPAVAPAAPTRQPPTRSRRRWLQHTLGGAASLALPLWARQAGAQDTAHFGLGVASGSPTATSVVLWTRLSGEGLPGQVPVQWELARDEAFKQVVARGSEQAVADEAHSVHAQANNLDAARAYWYRFCALGQRSVSGFTRTAPAAGADVANLRFHIASCQRFEHGHFAAWRDVADNAPDLVLFLGDYIYEYGSPPGALRRVTGGRTDTLSAYRQRYADYKADPHLQAAHAACPWLFTWDDHEVENDYAGLSGERLQPDFAAQRAAAYRAWWEHMPLPRAMKPVGPDLRIYGQLDWGRLARLHLLDDRQYRDLQVCPRPGRGGSHVVTQAACPELADPQRSLLGQPQEQWLAQGWSLERPWNLLAQQTLMARHWRGTAQTADSRGPAPAAGMPVVPQDQRVWTDGWDGYPAARTRLLQTVADRRVPGVVVLGGDVHANFVADLRVNFDDMKSAIVASEFCGTSITSSGGGQDWLDRAPVLNPHLHHARADQRGTVLFSLNRTQLSAELRTVHDLANPASVVTTSERFVVDAARAGVQQT